MLRREVTSDGNDCRSTQEPRASWGSDLEVVACVGVSPHLCNPPLIRIAAMAYKTMEIHASVKAGYQVPGEIKLLAKGTMQIKVT
jgi:hypothetical protein